MGIGIMAAIGGTIMVVSLGLVAVLIRANVARYYSTCSNCDGEGCNHCDHHGFTVRWGWA